MPKKATAKKKVVKKPVKKPVTKRGVGVRTSIK